MYEFILMYDCLYSAEFIYGTQGRIEFLLNLFVEPKAQKLL